jgi:Tol biopolymer transport system component
LSFTDWDTGGLSLRDLKTGKERKLIVTGLHYGNGDVDYADPSVISPDTSQVAYDWYLTKEQKYEVRIVSTHGGLPRTIARTEGLHDYFFVKDWSPDGKWLFTARGGNQIGLLSVADGSFRALKTLKTNLWQTTYVVSPDGRWIAYAEPPNDSTNLTDVYVIATDGSQDVAVAQSPANDRPVGWSGDGSRLYFISGRTGSPSLWSVGIESGKAKGEPQLVKPNIGPVIPMRMTSNGSFYYLVEGEYHDNIYTAELGPDLKLTRAPALMTDLFLNLNLGASLSPDGKTLAYISHGRLMIRTVDTGAEREIPLKFPPWAVGALHVGWFPDGGSLLVRSFAGPQKSELYKVSLATGDSALLHRANGAPFSLSPDGKSIYYLNVENSDAEATLGSQLMRYDIETKRETELRKGGDMTEVAISPDSKQLAYLVRRHPGTEGVVMVMPASGSEQPREVYRASDWNKDSVALEWTRDGKYLLFVRGGKTDDAPSVLWRAPADGGPAEQMGLSQRDRIIEPQLHPDGRRLFYTVHERTPREMWVLENFLPKTVAAK